MAKHYESIKTINTIVLPADLLATRLAQLTRSGNIFIIRCRFALPSDLHFSLFYSLFRILLELPMYDMIISKQSQLIFLFRFTFCINLCWLHSFEQSHDHFHVHVYTFNPTLKQKHFETEQQNLSILTNSQVNRYLLICLKT